MPTRVLLPQWGMGMNEGTIVKWLKQEGDALQVRTTIDADGQRTVLLDCYTRHA